VLRPDAGAQPGQRGGGRAPAGHVGGPSEAQWRASLATINKIISLVRTNKPVDKREEWRKNKLAGETNEFVQV